MNLRFLTDLEIETLVNPVLELRGWALLNIPTSKVLGAFQDDRLVEFIVLQLFPMLGPMVRVDNTLRDNGETSRALANGMETFLEENDARGWMAICDSPVTERICQRHGMQKVESPVYVWNARVVLDIET